MTETAFPTDPETQPAPLSERQERFCRAYLRCAGGGAAARAAGYAAAGARTQAWRLLRDPRVRRRIDDLRRAGGLPAPAHALELLAKLERLYEGAAGAGQFREALAVVEAQARLLDRYGLDRAERADAADGADGVDGVDGAPADAAGPPVGPADAPVSAESRGLRGAGAAADADRAAGDADDVDDADAVDAVGAAPALFDQDLDDSEAGPPPTALAEEGPRPYDPAPARERRRAQARATERLIQRMRAERAAADGAP